MAFCDVRDWTMALKIDQKAPVERFVFVLRSDGTGEVRIARTGVRMSDLIWECLSLGVFGSAGSKGMLTFYFRFRRMVQGQTREMAVVAVGFARQSGAATIFNGKLFTFAADSDTPTAGTAVLETLAPDEGDTGTGNGTQT
jgi:hypothetical protein